MRKNPTDRSKSSEVPKKTNDNILSEKEDFKLFIEKKQKYFLNTLNRFLLQDVMQNELNTIIKDKNKNILKCHRVAHSSLVDLMRNPDTNRAFYHGLITCGNSKLCPVCASRIMGIRSEEIRTAVNLWLSRSELNTCYMMTLTFSHSNKDSLDSLLDNFKKSLKRFWENGSLIRSIGESNRVGRITSTEIQYSRKNGFHPHQHILLFCEKHDFDSERLSNLWLNSLNACGLSGLSDIAFDLIEARSAENYLTKIGSEMALGNIKPGQMNGHYSPQGILQEIALGSKWAKPVLHDLFINTHGKKFLTWSKGLKAEFGINQISDEDISNCTNDSTLVRFFSLLKEDFKKLNVYEISMLRNYVAYNDYNSAYLLLHNNGIKIIKDLNFYE